jgi:uncharacterized protein
MPGPYHAPGVYIEEMPAGSRPIQGVSTAVAAFLGITEKCLPDKEQRSMIGRPHQVTNWDQFTEQFGGYVDGAMLPYAVRGFFDEGGSRCYVMSLATAEVLTAGSGGGTRRPMIELPSRTADERPTLRLEAKKAEPLTVKVTDAPDDRFNLEIQVGRQKPEKYENLTFYGGTDPSNVLTALQASALVTATDLNLLDVSLAERRPAAKEYPAVAPLAIPASEGIGNISSLAKGNLNERTGLEGLEAVTDVTMVCMPDIMQLQREKKITMEDAKGLQNAMIMHCKNMGDRMALLDAPHGMNAQEVAHWRSRVANYSSPFAALYYPWIVIQRPTGSGQIQVPPSGYMAGIYARVDRERGVHKAPANEQVASAIGLEREVTHREQEPLNQIGVNCIRAFPGRGIRVWGARTLDDPASEWRYINVRRLFNYIERSVFEGTQWVVFEPNDMDLWERVKRTINGFLGGLWRDGMLFGATPEQAYRVRCDEALNPPSARKNGLLVVEVAVAPVFPAEFVVFRFSQKEDGGEVSE